MSSKEHTRLISDRALNMTEAKRKAKSNWDDDIGTRVRQLVDYEERGEVGIFQLTDTQLLEYRNDSVAFGEACILWDGKPLRFDDYQKRWLQDKSTFRIANKSTRIGFSFINAFEAFHNALFFPESTCLFVSIKEDRAKDLLRYVYTFAESNPSLFDKVFISKPALECELTTGSRIYSLPNSASGVRGIPEVRGIRTYWDEVALFRDTADVEMYAALQRNVALGGSLSMWSTPYGKRGVFFEIAYPQHLAYRGENPDDKILTFDKNTLYSDFSYHEIPWWKCSRFQKTQIEKIKRNTDPVTYGQEYMCEFIGRGAELFPWEIIESAAIAKPESSATSNNPYYVGIDFAAHGQDKTAVVVMEHRKDKFVMKHLKQVQGRGTEYIKPLTQTLINNYSPSMIFVDETGMGIPICRELQLEFGSKVHGIQFTNPVKERMIMNLWGLFNDGKIEILNNKDLKNQFHRLETGETRTGLPTYQHRKGQHDDLVYASAMCCSQENLRWSGVVACGINLDDDEDDDDRGETLFVAQGG